jgi:deazaflavin-dependent oxidoreductase (nitroreductase family)
MPEKFSEPKRPRGLARLAFRLPIWLYRAHLGWLLGNRAVLLTHTGRKSGLPRQTVLEVVRYDKTTGACVVASGWGMKSDWALNVTENPKIVFQVRNKRTAGIAERLSAEAGAEELFNYAHRYPLALRELTKFMGYRLDGTEDDIRALGRMVPMFLLKPVTEEVGTPR